MTDQRTGGTASPLDVPDTRVGPLRGIAAVLESARRIVLTTHVNGDGDGAGSEAALAAWLSARGAQVRIVNPTPYPPPFRFLLDSAEQVADVGTAEGAAALGTADLLVVLDTGEKGRIGRIAASLNGRSAVVLDHHPAGQDAIPAIAELRDPTACATGELIFDLLAVAGATEPPVAVLRGLYAAIVTDTGSFRFSNTSPRAHAIAGELINRGVDPEAMYRHIYGTVPLRRVSLLRRALDGLEVDDELPITWITIPHGAMEELGAGSDDLEGIIDHARSIEGTELALLFRPTRDGSTKISFRSTGQLDVNALARRFGGGGHVKAAGALLAEPLETARERVLDAAREAVRALVAATHSV
ncbi:MAG: DHH family phosphoesterase [Longimicrobiales bacterium]